MAELQEAVAAREAGRECVDWESSDEALEALGAAAMATPTAHRVTC